MRDPARPLYVRERIMDRFGLRFSGKIDSAIFDQIKYFCMFIGYPRSGHSAVGALMNAHPAMVIAHELHALQYLLSGFSIDEIYRLILKRDRDFLHNDAKWEGFSYKVPDAGQGTHDAIQVIGDKKGGGSTILLEKYPDLLKNLRRQLTVPVRFIHQVRNPFDNIATIARRGGGNLNRAAIHFFKLCETNQRLLTGEISDADVLFMRHEDLIRDPRTEIAKWCEFLDLEATEPYKDACAAVIFDSPNKSRHKADWDEATKSFIQDHIEKYPFLDGYTFDD